MLYLKKIGIYPWYDSTDKTYNELGINMLAKLYGN